MRPRQMDLPGAQVFPARPAANGVDFCTRLPYPATICPLGAYIGWLEASLMGIQDGICHLIVI